MPVVLAACAPAVETAVPAPAPAAIVPQLPETFTTTNLTANPAMVLLGQLTIVSVIVTNTGEQAGNGTLTMFVDGDAAKSQNVTLAAGESQNVTFPLSSSRNGTHLIQIGDSTFKLWVHVTLPETTGHAHGSP